VNAQSIAIHFADQLCRERALTNQETDMLMTVVDKQRRRMLWTAKDDRDLRRLSRLMPAHVVAEQMGRTPWSVRNRIRRLKVKEVARGLQSAGA
jgi:hypothetical protein